MVHRPSVSWTFVIEDEEMGDNLPVQLAFHSTQNPLKMLPTLSYET